MRVLIVEDEPFNIIVLEEMIKIFYPEADISSAQNGAVGFDMLSAHEYDIVLSDVSMPVMDGYELIKKVKTELSITTPIIAVTAFAIQGDKEKLLLAGFDDYLSKPVDMSILEATLEKYAAKS